MGATASKNERVPPNFCRRLSARASEVSGPVATITIPSEGSSVTSPVTTSMFGSDLIFSVIYSENSSLSTASAPPAATEVLSAASMVTEPRRRISSLSNPAADSSRIAFSELEQTSSAKPSLFWAGVRFSGFISQSRTENPKDESLCAASHPASPAPITVILFIISSPQVFRRCSPDLSNRLSLRGLSSAKGSCRKRGIFPQ